MSNFVKSIKKLRTQLYYKTTVFLYLFPISGNTLFVVLEFNEIYFTLMRFNN